MSYEIVKSIVLKDKEQQVWLNSADSSIRPLSFSSWECKGLSEIYQKEGREAALARIGKDVWDGNLHLYQGNKLCKLFLQAREALPDGLSFMNFDGQAAWAAYPAMYADDKDFALEMLRLNGCHYRSLSGRLKADREIIMEAFAEAEGKTYHEHLPDLIPAEALWKIVDGTSIVLDREFVCDLLEKCPSMHLSREPLLVNDGTICLKWCEVGKWFPHSVKDVPVEFLQTKEFQDVLIGRFEGTELYGKLVEKMAEKGIVLPNRSVDDLVEDASARVGVNAGNSKEQDFEKE